MLLKRGCVKDAQHFGLTAGRLLFNGHLFCHFAAALYVSWLKPGAVVIDVGINSVDDPTSKKGKTLYFWSFFSLCSYFPFVLTSYFLMFTVFGCFILFSC